MNFKKKIREFVLLEKSTPRKSSIFNFCGVIFSVITLVQTSISTSTVRFS